MFTEIRPKIRNVLSFRELHREVNRAGDLMQFDFSKTAGGIRVELGSGRNASVAEQEPDLTSAIILSMGSEGQHYSLLKSLQGLGFDIFHTVSMPKGERYCITHDNTPKLEEYLSGRDLPKARLFQAVRAKFVSPALRIHGRLHVRFYQHIDSQNLVATSHIDLPDINHLRASQHLSGHVKVDYESGTDLFNRVLKYLRTNPQKKE
jgi:hypothetical protein